MKNVVIVLIVIGLLLGCANALVRPIFIEHGNTEELIAQTYFRKLLKALPPSKFHMMQLKGSVQYETIEMGINGLEYATTARNFVIFREPGTPTVYFINFDNLEKHYLDFEEYLKNSESGRILKAYYTQAGIVSDASYFYEVLMPSIGKAFRGETLNFTEYMNTVVYEYRSRSYPEEFIKCPGGKDIQPKFKISGFNANDQRTNIWAGFCDDKPYKTYEYGKGWFDPDELLSKVVQEQSKLEGRRMILRERITNLTR